MSCEEVLLSSKLDGIKLRVKYWIFTWVDDRVYRTLQTPSLQLSEVGSGFWPSLYKAWLDTGASPVLSSTWLLSGSNYVNKTDAAERLFIVDQYPFSAHQVIDEFRGNSQRNGCVVLFFGCRIQHVFVAPGQADDWQLTFSGFFRPKLNLHFETFSLD